MLISIEPERTATLEPVIHKPGVVTVDGFLTKSQCDALIQAAEQGGFEAATVRLPGGPQMRTDIRNNDRYMVDDFGLAGELWKGAELFTDAFDFDTEPACLNERIRFYRYDPTQRFKRHRDGTESIRGMTSRLTFMVYLNDDFDGGATVFSDSHEADGERAEDTISIEPKTGTALFFIHHLWHEGQVLIEGRKYVLRTDVLYKTD